MTAPEPSPPGKSTPVNPRVALIYGVGDGDRLAEIQGLLQVMGAGRYFAVDAFDPVDPDQYNFYVIGAAVVDGAPDAGVTGFVATNRDWLCAKRVVLIAHQGCAFYAARLGLEGEAMERAQRDDLARAVEFVREVTGLDAVDTFFARVGERATLFAVPPRGAQGGVA